ncbi:DUF6090 family protein [Gaetbulibacter aestuarii]|uniref:DUF6090 family protein n=1 Tax=Gaetbulibacter aestuarii TaxID=1502358 RepID=A0ABW7MVQ0_9FLAO
MIKLFNNIRKQLIKEGKVLNYLKYAVGEIVLVVIGILIALSINNWNEQRHDRQLERQYLENFAADFKRDYNSFEYFKNSVPKKIKALLLARKYIFESPEIKDTLKFIDTLGYGGVGSRTSFFENQSTYKDITSTGNLRLIQNEKIRQAILTYYQYSENTEVYLNNLRTDYSTFMNSLYPYDRKKSFKPYPKEIKKIMSALKTDSYLKLTNDELAFAYALGVRMNGLTDFNTGLLKMIETELK